MGSWCITPLIFKLDIDGGEWLASHPGHFTRRKKHSTHWTVGWMDLILGLEDYGEVKICWPFRDSNSRTVHPVATDYDIPLPSSISTETSKYISQDPADTASRKLNRKEFLAIYLYSDTCTSFMTLGESPTFRCTLCFPPWGQSRLLASFHMLRSNRCAVFFHPYHHD